MHQPKSLMMKPLSNQDLLVCPNCQAPAGWFCSIYCDLMTEQNPDPSTYNCYLCAECQHRWQVLNPKTDAQDPGFEFVPTSKLAEDCAHVAQHHPSEAVREMAGLGALYFGAKSKKGRDEND